jgi:hypothetical protein
MDTVRNQAGIPYVTSNAILRCPFGLMTSILNVVDPSRPSIGINKMATIQDRLPVNIPPFGMCTSILNPAVQSATMLAMGTLTPAPCPCVQAMMGWSLAPNNVVNTTSYFIDQTCTLLCSFGGNIMIVHSGQGVSAPVPVPCKPLESNYELPEWLEGVTTIAKLTPWGWGLDIIESAGYIKQGKYFDAALNFIPVKKAGKLGRKGLDKVLEKTVGSNSENIAQKFIGSETVQKVVNSKPVQNVVNSKPVQNVVDSKAGKVTGEIAADMAGNKVEGDVKNTIKDVKNTVAETLFGGEPEGFSDNKDIAQAATGLPTDEFDKYTDYGGAGNSGGSR